MNMEGVDLNTYVFDYDLTFSILFMAPDGRILHHYGNRDPSGAQSHLSMDSLAAVMRTTLTEFPALTPVKLKKRRPSTVEELPTMARRVKAGKGPECFHCHMVFQARDEGAREDGKWDERDAWRWPDGGRVGLHTDRDDQSLVTSVDEGSAAAKAGFLAGDRLLRGADRPIATEGDLQAVLEGVPSKGGKPSFVVRRGEEERTLRRGLAKGWREGGPLDMAWRGTMWRLDPKPGFGGRAIDAAAKGDLGIPVEQFAFRVGYLVTWGPNAHTGRNAHKAGIRKDDVVVSVGGKTDFRSELHFQSWFRLEHAAGESVEIVVIRGGERKTIALPTVSGE